MAKPMTAQLPRRRRADAGARGAAPDRECTRPPSSPCRPIPRLRPVDTMGARQYADFFECSMSRSRFGSAWSAAEDEARANVVVARRETQ